MIVERGDLAIRRMRDIDEEYDRMVRWRNSPHVRMWWDPDDPPLTREAAIEEYRSDIMPGSPSTACIVELGGQPIGFLQFYRWSSYASDAQEIGIDIDERSWGIDVFIGEPDQVGKGIGTRMVRLACDYLEAQDPASSIALLTEVDNAVAIRCYEKAGFTKITQVLDTDTRNGERVQSWLMVR